MNFYGILGFFQLFSYLEASYHKVKHEWNYGEEVYKIHRLLEESPLPRRTHEPHQILEQEEQHYCIF